MVSKIHTKKRFNFGFLKRLLGDLLGPDSGRFGQIPADSGRFGRVLFERPNCVLAQTPPLWAQHASKVSPKALKTSEKLPRTSYHDPTKFRWIKFPRSGFLFLQI